MITDNLSQALSQAYANLILNDWHFSKKYPAGRKEITISKNLVKLIMARLQDGLLATLCEYGKVTVKYSRYSATIYIVRYFIED